MYSGKVQWTLKVLHGTIDVKKEPSPAGEDVVHQQNHAVQPDIQEISCASLGKRISSLQLEM